jgi:protein involved in polysaccharide export with SLBB domain
MMIHDRLSLRNVTYRLGQTLLGALIVELACAGLWAATAAEEYRVGPLDRIKIKVSEWRPTSGEVFEWPALSGEFTVSAAGTLSMPVIGSFPVENATTGAIAGLISERLKSTAGLVSGPSAAVEIAQYRPFYVVGGVERPGEYAFRPGMNVIQAVSIAGGFYRPETTLARFERDTIVAEGEIRVNETQRLALLLRRDRLLSEAGNVDRIAFSEAVTQHPDARMAQQGQREESTLFGARQTTARSQLELLQRGKALLEDELKTLAAKALTQRKQQELVRKDLDNINSLMSKGLSVSPRQLAVEQNLAQLESQALDLILATARTRQDIGKTDLNIAELQNKRETEINKELRETQISLSQVTDRVDALRALVHESSVWAPRQLARQASEAARLTMTVVRRSEGAFREVVVAETDQVLPGDLIKIERASLQRIMSDASGATQRPAGAKWSLAGSN